MKKQWFGYAVLLAFSAGGCTASLGSEGEEVGSAQQWLCDTADGVASCEAAIPSDGDTGMSYTCMPGDGTAGCPSDFAIGDLEAQLDALGIRDYFDDAPWACLLTGELQRECMKDLVALDPEAVPAAPETITTSEGVLEAPPVPVDCSNGAWEEWFRLQANFEFQSADIDIDFPAEIFDASAPSTRGISSLPGRSDGVSEAPGCSGPEWEMRSAAWLTATTAGCMQLSREITTLCQQAADYAPTTGECSATGTW